LLSTALSAAARVGLATSSVFQFSDEEYPAAEGVADWRRLLVSAAQGERYVWDDMSGTATRTVATVNYSSGTTGLPKGVMITHANLIANVQQTIFSRDQEQSYDPAERPEERWLGLLPLYHAFGMSPGASSSKSTQRRSTDMHCRATVCLSHGRETAGSNLHHVQV